MTRFALCTCSLLLAAVRDTAAEPLLTIIISRHGVRTPYPPCGEGNLTKESMTNYTSKPFPACWPPGADTSEIWGTSVTAALTPHGGQQIKNMGGWMGRANFSSVKCNEVAVYADTHSRRDIETATNWTAGAFPSCDALHAEDVIYGDPDKQLFNDGTNDTLCQYPSKDVILALLGGSDGGFAALRDSWGSEIDTIDRVVNCCPVNMCGTQPCNLSAIPITYEGKPWAATGGGHDLAIFWAEFFLLEYLNGNKQFALGQLSPDELVRLYRMAVDYLEIMDSALAAPSFESTLAAQIVASMVQARSGQPVPGVRHPPSAKVVYMAGHDTNLVLLRKLLGLRWHTAGWAENAAPPGGMLIFELADVPGRGFEVSAYFQAARPEQLREGQDFASQAPPRSPVPIPGCPIGKELSCPFEHFRSVVLASLRTECVATEGLKDFVLAAPAPGPVPSTNWWAVLAAGVAAFALGLGLCAFVRRRRSLCGSSDESMRELSEAI